MEIQVPLFVQLGLPLYATSVLVKRSVPTLLIPLELAVGDVLLITLVFVISIVTAVATFTLVKWIVQPGFSRRL